MADLIYKNTGLVIEPFVATSYAGVIEALCQDPPKAHMASLATFSYILASEKGCAQTALVSTHYGSASYNGQFIVSADSDYESIEDLKGATWCVSDAFSTSGVIIPKIMFQGVGINPDTDLGEMVEAGSHEAAAAGVYNGDCDFATTYVDARTALEEDYPDIMEKTKVIAVEPDIPNDGIQFVTGFPGRGPRLNWSLLSSTCSIPKRARKPCMKPIPGTAWNSMTIHSMIPSARFWMRPVFQLKI